MKKAGMWMEDFNLNTNIEIAGVRFKNPVMTANVLVSILNMN